MQGSPQLARTEVASPAGEGEQVLGPSESPWVHRRPVQFTLASQRFAYAAAARRSRPSAGQWASTSGASHSRDGPPMRCAEAISARWSAGSIPAASTNLRFSVENHAPIDSLAHYTSAQALSQFVSEAGVENAIDVVLARDGARIVVGPRIERAP